MISRTVSHYEIKEKLGGGGMGVVYLARDTRLDREVAIKFLPPDYFGDRVAEKRFEREAKSAAALSHPHICHVYDVGEFDNQPFLVMERLRGQTLKHRLDEGPIELNEALKLPTQIAAALQAAHAKGIIHRDIKPANIFITGEGYAKVLDFGLAKRLESRQEAEEDLSSALTRVGATLGTLAYMSPEQLRGKELDARTDIFSFGVVLYEMLTGVHPFRRESANETVGAILNEEPAPLTRFLTETPEALQHILRKMLAKDPRRRAQTMRGVQNDLEQLVEDSGKQPRSTEQTRTRWIWPTVSVSSALAVLLVSTILWFSQEATSNPSALAFSEPTRLTSYPGFEYTPTFSPDGSQIAFSWDGEEGDNNDIYLKLTESGQPVRRTHDPARDWYPRWSPDGSQIAFLRNEPSGQFIWLIPPLGGSEEQLIQISNSRGHPEFSSASVAWTPDGKFLITSLVSGSGLRAIHLVSPQTGETRQLTDPSAGSDWYPEVSPDGRTLAFLRSLNSIGDIYILSLSETLEPIGLPERITKQGFRIRGLAWSADGEKIIYSAGIDRFNFRLWMIDINSREVERVPLPGHSLTRPVVSSKGQLAYAARFREANIYSHRLADGRIEAGDPQRVIDSTTVDFEPVASPDGSRLAFMSDRTGEMEIYLSSINGTAVKKLSSFGGIRGGIPDWSPNGQLIAVDSRIEGQPEIYTVDVKTGVHIRVTYRSEIDAVPRFSRDGSWIYFTSSSPGKTPKVWKIPVEGGEGKEILVTEGRMPWESPKGHYLYFLRGSEIWRKELSSGKEEKVFERELPGGYGGYEPVGKGVFFDSWNFDGRERSLYYLDPISRKVTFSGLISDRSTVDWGDITLDGRMMIFAQVDREGSDIMLVENFR